jgi:hypothetical protein
MKYLFNTESGYNKNVKTHHFRWPISSQNNSQAMRNNSEWSISCKAQYSGFFYLNPVSRPLLTNIEICPNLRGIIILEKAYIYFLYFRLFSNLKHYIFLKFLSFIFLPDLRLYNFCTFFICKWDGGGGRWQLSPLQPLENCANLSKIFNSCYFVTIFNKNSGKLSTALGKHQHRTPMVFSGGGGSMLKHF